MNAIFKNSELTQEESYIFRSESREFFKYTY